MEVILILVAVIAILTGVCIITAKLMPTDDLAGNLTQVHKGSMAKMVKYKDNHHEIENPVLDIEDEVLIWTA